MRLEEFDEPGRYGLQLTFEDKELRYAGVDNVTDVVMAPKDAQHLLSRSGIVGHQMTVPRLETYRWSSQTLLVLHSDGLARRWSLSDHPGLARGHPSTSAVEPHAP